MERSIEATSAKRILIVDNDRIFQKRVVKRLENAGHTVQTASDGLNALDVLKEFEPDVIFIDLVMPNIDGRNLCRMLRNMDRFKDTMLVILSAVSTEDCPDFLILGANACIAKGPFNETARYILLAVEDPESIITESLTGRVFGVESVYKSEIAEELLSEKKHVEIILRKMIEGVLEVNADGRIVYANPSALSMIGKSIQDTLGQPLLTLFNDNDRRRIREKLKTQTTKTIPFYRPVYLNGHMMTVNLIPLDGPQTSTIVILNDITKIKLVEKKLEQRVAERTKLAEDRSRQLRALVSELTVTEQRARRRLAEVLHDDLQQLLVAVKFNSQVLSLNLGEESKKIAENIQTLIDQSIRVSRSLTNELSPTVLQQGSLSAALQWSTRWFEETHGLEVDLEVDEACDPERGDIMLFLFQSVQELLLNVVKHAGVKSARVELSHDGKNRLRVAVIDQGAGFDPDTIWEKAKAGTGFGLLSIRERLMLLGGELEIESAFGKGASFTLFVPSKTKGKDQKKGIQRAIPGLFPAKSRDNIRVLLVDDHAIVRQGISSVLSRYPEIEIIGQAADGEAAVRMAKKLEPDVVLLDISMPKMDGIEATRIIHSEFPDIRIIGFSMHDKRDQAARMIEAGASAYFSKDGETANLLAAIREGEI